MLPNFLYTEVTAWVGVSIKTFVLTMRNHRYHFCEPDVKLDQQQQQHVKSSLHLKACRDGALTTAGGKAFQLSTNLNEKKFCLRLA